MSRIGNLPIPVPSGVDVSVADSTVTVKGPGGTLTQALHEAISVNQENGNLKVTRATDEREHRALHGLMRSLIANMVIGVSEGYTRSLELVGVGYRVAQEGKGINLSVMLSHQVVINPPDGVTIEVEGNNQIHIRGIDKQAVGQLAAEIKKIRPPNIYTGKGIRYRGEQIRLKPGKSARRA